MKPITILIREGNKITNTIRADDFRISRENGDIHIEATQKAKRHEEDKIGFTPTEQEPQ